MATENVDTKNNDEKDIVFDTTDTSNIKNIESLITTHFNQQYLISPNQCSIHSMDIQPIYKQTDCKLSQCIGLKRIKNSLTRYHTFIQHQNEYKMNEDDEKQKLKIKQSQKQNEITQNQSTVELNQNDKKHQHVISNDIYFDNSNNMSVLNDFNHLLIGHPYDFERIYNELVETCNNSKYCVLNSCLMMKRNHRDRESLRKNNIDLKRIYFSDNTDDSINDIIKQQIMDKIHCHYFHSFDIGYALSSNDKLKIRNNIHNSDESKDICNDQDGGISDTIVFEICKEIRMRKQLYKNTQVIERLSNASKKFVAEMNKPDAKANYSYGFRYFYWDYYKNSVEFHDPVRHYNELDASHANKGYTLAEFFIVPKFNDLKNELINNPICSISNQQWNILIQTCEEYVKTELYRKRKCTVHNSETYYNIPSNTAISCLHLVAMCTYCNQDLLQSKFTETYRKMSNDETIDSLAKRHRNYAHLGRLLREIVDCFGDKSLSNQIYFHGVSTELQFCSMYASIKGPTSTSTDPIVAVSFCANRGIILELELGHRWRYISDEYYERCLFDCQYISDFTNEKEIFFIGGSDNFLFKTIIKAQTGLNYEKYVNSFATISMFLLDTIDQINVDDTQENNQVCFRIILDELHRHYPDNNQYVPFKMPEYARLMLQAHFANITAIELFKKECRYEYLTKLFRCLFFYDYGWIKLDVLTTLFPSLQSLIFKDQQRNNNFVGCKSIYLSLLSLLKKNPNTSLGCVEICMPTLAHNKDVANKVKDVIAQFEKQFSKLDWKIEHDGSVLRIMDQDYKNMRSLFQ